ncbi:ATPase [Thermoplasmatales archaeon SG8-52-2]|nr:MAG: ATPase [Thermoplasmatales archaeon SG8-52-2]
MYLFFNIIFLRTVENMPNKRYFAGIDVGTSYIKVVIIDDSSNIVGSFIDRTSSDLQKSIKNVYNKAISSSKISHNNIEHITATGFGRENVSFSNSVVTEISSHAKGAYHYFPKKIIIVDIGGQDTKIIKIDEKGKIQGFKMNRKCAAGTGSFLEEIAYKLNIPMNQMNMLAKKSDKETALSSFCTVFASTEIITRIKEGERIEDMVRSAFESIAKRVIEMDTLLGTVVATGGVVTYNKILLKILSKQTGKEILTPPNPQLSGAIGAAIFSKEEKIIYK